ncbi:MAG: ATP-binding cassette domain-containing protein [Methanobacteriota archaeon]
MMITKTIRCPTCGSLATVTGDLGDKRYVTCLNCGAKGKYIFLKKDLEQNGQQDAFAIEVRNLTKNYNGFKAVNDVSFTVKKGEVFGFLGPNGAGKTTTIKAILDLIHVNTGEVMIHGINVRTNGKKAKEYVGYLPEKIGFYSGLTAMQNLLFYAEMKQVKKEECSALLAEMTLGDVSNKKVSTFSKGMLQRLALARAMLGNPPLFIFDEPTEGLDARGVILVREKIRRLKNQGSTVFVSSHILSEIQAVCDRVGIINKGLLVAEDTISGLSQRLNLKPRITMTLEKMSNSVVEAVKNVVGDDAVKIQDRQIDVVCDSQMKVKVILAIASAGGNILNFQTREPTLEEVFMRFTEA